MFSRIQGYFQKSSSEIGGDFNRWRIPPAALAIHLCIGQAYSFSVFNLPLTKILGVTQSTPEDWKLSQVTLIFSLAFVMLGLSAAVFGKWLESAGPRLAMFFAAILFSGGFFISALGIQIHQIYLLYLGYGIFGGIGLGLGYISPVSTLMKWFPDRPGMATGMAIMGFGGGAMIGSPLAVGLMGHFASETSTGVLPTFLTMGTIYAFLMIYGVVNIRVPKAGWAPKNFKAISEKKQMALKPVRDVLVEDAMKTKQFWLLWIMLCANVTAGIAMISQASPMIQEMFAGQVDAKMAAMFVGLLSFFNLIGRFIWSSLSDLMGRKMTYSIYFGLGLILYSCIPIFGKSGSVVFFIGTACLIISMYGGGFSTIPAYLKDIFGLVNVGAIHGRLLTAWSTAGILGPTLITYIREQKMSAGGSAADGYSLTMYIMSGFLLIGFVANRLVHGLGEQVSDAK
jgi:MFS family permease